MGRPSAVYVRIGPEGIRVGGKASIICTKDVPV